jgi:hypothetical protein
MSESVASREIREAGETARQAARWADPLTQAERAELAARLTKAMEGCSFKDWNSYGTYSPARVMAKAEFRDLLMDVNGRTGTYL